MIVYTAVFGGYDTLGEPKFPGICLTDGSVLAPGWQVRRVLGLQKPQWLSRHCKILSHIYFPEAAYSIYHDGNVTMLASPKKILRLLGDKDLAVFPHPERDCAYAEAEVVVRLRKAPKRDVGAHMAAYRRDGYPQKNGLATCCVLVRKHTPAVRALEELWWHEFRTRAKRDQLSFNYACWKLGIEYAEIGPGNVFTRDSPHFSRTPHRRPK